MRDRDVRKALVSGLLVDHFEDTLLVQELGLFGGACRVDVALVNGSLHGYEIKSDKDTLERLPVQIEMYSAILDYATLVVGSKHVDKASDLVPKWWGITIATADHAGLVSLKSVRTPKCNPRPQADAIAGLLWRDEALQVLVEIGMDRGYHSKPRDAMCQRIASAMDLSQLRDRVRQALKTRPNWRVD
jgi:hypothetical protein